MEPVNIAGINPFFNTTRYEHDKQLATGTRLIFIARTKSSSIRYAERDVIKYRDEGETRTRKMRGDAWDALPNATLQSNGEKLCNEWREAVIRNSDEDTRFSGKFSDMAEHLQKGWDDLGDKYLGGQGHAIEELEAEKKRLVNDVVKQQGQNDNLVRELERTRVREREQALLIEHLKQENEETTERNRQKNTELNDLRATNDRQRETISHLRGVLGI